MSAESLVPSAPSTRFRKLSQISLVEGENSGTQSQLVGIEAEKPRRRRGLGLLWNEGDVQMSVVGRLVLGEADIPMNAENLVTVGLAGKFFQS